MITSHAEAAKTLPEPKMLIGGEWVSGARGGTMQHVDPTTGTSLPEFVSAEVEDVDAAVNAAVDAFREWRRVTADKRRQIMLAIAQALRTHEPELTQIMALESGGPVSRPTLKGMADNFEYFAGWADKFAGELAHTYPRRALDYIRYEPLGVIAALPTWNGPMINTAMKLAPALATGNVAIVRPPEMGPYGIRRMVSIMIEAGLPANVVSVLTGGPAVADALVRHPAVDKISFTGGLITARKVLQAAAEHIRPTVMELGGKSANIVFDDADLDDPGFAQTVLMVIGSAGQGCMYGTRLLVQDGIYERVVKKVLEVAKVPKMGDPLDPGTNIGPVISEQASERILSYVNEASASGARVVVGGERAGGDLASGYFVQPTVLVDVDNSSKLAQEEIFGPILGIIRFDSEEDALKKANDTIYGLHAYLHTRDLKRAHRVADDLVAGGVSINAPAPLGPTMPFGGVKASGWGREGGRAALEEFIHCKNVSVPLD